MTLATPRLIPRLDIKGPNLIKGICFEGLRVIGDPRAFALRYADDADELLYYDTVASLYGRNQLTRLLERTTAEVFVPVTVEGGIKSIGDIKRLLDAGADTVALNTAAIARPAIIRECADYYGSQAVVASVQAKRVGRGGWEAYTENGRQRTGKDAVAWACEAVALGAGEILVTSIDQDGTQRGFDIPLVKAIVESVSVPVIASGGMGTLDHLVELYRATGVSGIAMASVLHYGRLTLRDMREALRACGAKDVREPAPRFLGRGRSA